jgi:cytochrome c2
MSRSFKDQLRKQASCDDKVGLTREVAVRIAKQSGEVMAYRCEFCHEWHVGNSIGGPRLRGRRK